MDKRSLLAIGLITVVILLLPVYYDWVYDIPPQDSAVITSDSSNVTEKSDTVITQSSEPALPRPDEVVETKPAVSAPGPVSSAMKAGLVDSTSQKFYTIETPLVSAKISNKGGGSIVYWKLKNYQQPDSQYVSIVKENRANGPELTFQRPSGEFVIISNYNFTLENELAPSINLQPGQKLTVTFKKNFGASTIRKSLTFSADDYHIIEKVEYDNPKELLLNNEYQIGWKGGLPLNELNLQEENTYTEAYANMGDELETYNIDEEGKSNSESLNGQVSWIANRTKYFISAVAVVDAEANGVAFGGMGFKREELIEKRFDTFLNIERKPNKADTFIYYMGPLDHDIISNYDNGLDKLIMNHGWYERTFRPISLIILTVFKFFHKFIPNYGLVIVLFSILIKIIVYPLTRKSYRSMKEMSKVQPLVTELREKYKNDPQRMNSEMMKLYKQHGVNPLGGCLPVVLQLPLLGALFIVFRSTIQLRGASFIPGWIYDLSQPDTLAVLPFSLPFYGDHFNLLPILMAVSMILQSKMTMQDPKQKAMVYLMPVFMLFLFNNFPSGLNLYYTLFNVLTIFQQKFIDGSNTTPQPAVVKGPRQKKK